MRNQALYTPKNLIFANYPNTNFDTVDISLIQNYPCPNYLLLSLSCIFCPNNLLHSLYFLYFLKITLHNFFSVNLQMFSSDLFYFQRCQSVLNMYVSINTEYEFNIYQSHSNYKSLSSFSILLLNLNHDMNILSNSIAHTCEIFSIHLLVKEHSCI